MRKLTNISINTVRGVVIPGFNFLLGILGVRMFGKENWGTFINVFLWIYLLIFILNWGNKDYLLRKYSKEPAKLFSFFYTNFFTRSLLFPISLIFFLFFESSIALIAILLVFSIHIFNSFESLIIYQQKFKTQLLAEIIGFGTIALGFFYFDSYNLTGFLLLYCFSFFLKNLFLIIQLKLFENAFLFRISPNELKVSFVFFLLGLSGLLSSKADLYLVNYYLPKDKISEYQIVTSAFLLLQSLSVFIMAPINKQFYRLNEESVNRIKKLAQNLFVPFAVITSIFIWLFLEKIARLGVDPSVYQLGFLASIPAFLYVIPILNLYKKKKEKTVLYANLFAGLLNLLITLVLLPKYGIKGAITSACVSQWIFLIIIKRYENNTSRL